MVKCITYPDNELGYLLMQVSLLKQRLTNHALKEKKITYMQFVVLATVYELSQIYEETTQHLLVKEKQLDKSMVSGILKTLIGRKLLERYENPADTRSKIVKLTTEGAQLILEAKKIVANVNNHFFSSIDKSTMKEMLTILLNKEDRGGSHAQ